MKKLSIAAILFLLAACAQHKTLLINAEGKERYCEASGQGGIGIHIANYQHANCVNAAGKEGFKPK